MTLLRLCLAVLAVVAAACGGSDDGASSSAGARTVTIANFEFAPDTLEVKVGDTVTVDNKDQTEHTVTARDKPFEYICEIHPFMPPKTIRVVA